MAAAIVNHCLGQEVVAASIEQKCRGEIVGHGDDAAQGPSGSSSEAAFSVTEAFIAWSAPPHRARRRG